MGSTRLDRDAGRAAGQARDRLRDDIDRLCTDAGLSHAALARAAGVSPSFLARILAGSTRPSLETYGRLAAALGADLSTRLYPTTGPAIRDRLSVPVLEALLAQLHPRWRPFTEVRVRRPGRDWIDVALHEPRERVIVAGELQSVIGRVEELVRWSREKADSLPSWSEWPTLREEPEISRLLVVRWTRSTRAAVDAARDQLRLAYPAHPDDAVASLTGTARWPGAALVWAKVDGSGVRLLGRR